MTEQAHWTTLRDEAWADQLSAQKAAKEAARKRISAMTPNQGKYLKAIDSKSAVICTGPWGTGKTFLAAAKGVEMLLAGQVDKVVLSRPLKECGEEMGFLPGDLYAKVVDMMMPLIESMEEFMPAGEFERMRADGRVVIVPLEKMRGRTMKRAFVVLDEAQNATRSQINMFLSRYGSGKMILCGDYTQSDLNHKGMNPLLETTLRLQSEPNAEVGVIELTDDDIVRSGLARYFHRVLTKPFGPAETPMLPKAAEQEKARSGFDMVPCPSCDGSVWYQSWVANADRLVTCPRCKTYIELLDPAGRLDPRPVEAEPEDVAEAVLGLDRQPT